jgi:cytoskeletal protein CcmA (bactofilin family)
MFGKKRPKVIDRIDTLISAGTEISGDLTFSGGMRIDGIVRGNVTATGNVDGALVLSQAARVEGEIKVTHAVVNGTILGPLQAKDYVELQSKAKVTGDVSYRTIEVQIGAVAQGRLQYLEDPKDDKVLPFKVPTSEKWRD